MDLVRSNTALSFRIAGAKSTKFTARFFGKVSLGVVIRLYKIGVCDPTENAKYVLTV